MNISIQGGFSSRSRTRRLRWLLATLLLIPAAGLVGAQAPALAASTDSLNTVVSEAESTVNMTLAQVKTQSWVPTTSDYQGYSGDWCGWWVSALLHNNAMPLLTTVGTSGQTSGTIVSWYQSQGRYQTVASGAQPRAGALIIYSGHVGLVAGVSGGTAQTIEGNTGYSRLGLSDSQWDQSEVTQFASPWGQVIGYAYPLYAGYDSLNGVGDPGNGGMGTVAYGVTSLLLPSGQLVLYTIRGDGNLWGDTQQSAGGSFGGWQLIGGANGTLTGRPSVVRTASGLIVAYARTTAGTIVGAGQSSVGGAFSGWQPIGANGGGIVSDPAAIQLQSGIIAIYATTSAQTVSGVAQTSVGGGFGGWQTIGSSPVGLDLRPSVIQLADGRIVIYAHSSATNMIYGSGQTVAGGTFQTWTAIGTNGGGIANEPTVSLGSDGRISIFDTAGGTLAGVTQPAPGQSFGSWVNYGSGGTSLLTAAALVPLSDGTVALYTRAADSSVWGTVLTPGQTAPAGWSNIGSGANVATAVTAKQTPSGMIALYGNSGNGGVTGSSQSTAGGSFGAWVTIN
ncbi:hypothetical protein ABH923_001599 [Leifsonia sp. EB41]|uniref:CHAP domain-containing protein n=1 Tax=Leifsonia sp. EB41 TaxID=3156260 RepID=UPI003513C318